MRRFALVVLGLLVVVAIVASSHRSGTPRELAFSPDTPSGVPIPDEHWVTREINQPMQVPDIALSMARGKMPAQWLVHQGLCPQTHDACVIQVLFRWSLLRDPESGAIKQILRYVVRSAYGMREGLVQTATEDVDDHFWFHTDSWRPYKDIAERTYEARFFDGLQEILVYIESQKEDTPSPDPA